MKVNGRILCLTAGLVLVVAAFGAICYGLVGRARKLHDHNLELSALARQSMGAVCQARNIHMQLYKALSWAASGYDEKKTAELLTGAMKDLDRLAAGLQKLSENKELSLAQAEQCRQAGDTLKTYRKWAAQVADLAAADAATATMSMGSAEDAYQALNARLTQLAEENQTLCVREEQAARGFLTLFSRLWVILSAAVALMLCGISVYLLRSIAMPLQQSIRMLSGSAASIAGASHNLSATSQSLAQGANEQAASLEEISSSLEEMAGMTTRNAENARAAKEHADQTNAAADGGLQDMRAMSAAMDVIKASSDDIGKIIKTINEIAFQTNLLALNAAVEAARAGEAGMGFAVVADEVRNLARRSADAAKDITARVEGAITRTAQGVQISLKVGQSLSQIASKAGKVNELVTAIAQASGEQSQGLNQVNRAMAQMDKVTQGNAAEAEEAASAATQLSAEGETLRKAVAELLRLASGEAKVRPSTHALSVIPGEHAASHGMAKAGLKKPTRQKDVHHGQPTRPNQGRHGDGAPGNDRPHAFEHEGRE